MKERNREEFLPKRAGEIMSSNPGTMVVEVCTVGGKCALVKGWIETQS